MRGLSALIVQTPRANFLDQFERNRPYLEHDLAGTISELTQLPFLASIDALLKLWPDCVQAHLPKVRDEASSIEVTTGDAIKLFQNGMGLLFENAEKHAPILVEWLAAIVGDLGLSALTQSRCLLYATPKGGGTAPHFDQNVNFVLQVHGTKKWWTAPNDNVENPLSRHTMGLPVDPELETYAAVPMPTEMPGGIAPFILEPGSLLFVPRGLWHATEAVTDALSLNFTFSPPSYLDLLTAALRSRLALSREWRETVHGITSSEAKGGHGVAAQKFDALLSELIQDLPNWTAADILGATEGK